MEKPSVHDPRAVELLTIGTELLLGHIVDGKAGLVEGEATPMVHVHNTFPGLSPAVIRAARRAGAAVVATLHNYRLVCPGGNLLRAGVPCEDCVGRVPWRAVAHACYGGSRAASAVTATMLQTHRVASTWAQVDAFITLTSFAREIFLQAGLPPDRLHVKPNFVSPDPGRGQGGEAFLFVGRLDEQKGVQVLLRAWEGMADPPELRIIGEGPLEGAVRTASHRCPSIRPLGTLPHSAVLAQLQHAAAFVFPSLSYEGFPMAVAEAFACGVPVVASDHGAAAVMVEDGVSGVRVRPGDPSALASAVARLAAQPELRRRLGDAARAIYLEWYGAAANYERLQAIYASARQRRGVA